jgi:ABC-2 type transport system permease protein
MAGSIGALRRLCRLWRASAYLDLLWMTRDLKQFLLYWSSDLVLNVASVTAVFLLAERFGRIGAWSKPQLFFMLGYAAAVKGVLEVLFGYNVLYISRRLGRGQLDHTLVQPQPLSMALLTEGFVPYSGSAALLTGMGLMAWGTAHLGHPITAGWLGFAVVNGVASAVIVLAFTFTWGSMAFWAPRAAEEINSSSLELVYQLKQFPLDGLGPALTGGLLTLLPVGFVAWYPCRALVGLGDPVQGTAVTCLAAALFGALALVIFRRGLRHYGRTGSQRYLSYGHRR